MSPLRLHREILATPVGEAVLLTDDAGRVRALDFAEFDARTRRLLDRHYGPGRWTQEPREGPPTAALAALSAYFAGDIAALDAVETATGGTPFQREVWAALRRAPAGETLSYAALAQAVGRPKAVRAVGAANGANPVALVAPCHRVIGSGGALTGYAGGLERKAWLLDHERRHARKSADRSSAAAPPRSRA